MGASKDQGSKVRCLRDECVGVCGGCVRVCGPHTAMKSGLCERAELRSWIACCFLPLILYTVARLK